MSRRIAASRPRSEIGWRNGQNDGLPGFPGRRKEPPATYRRNTSGWLTDSTKLRLIARGPIIRSKGFRGASDRATELARTIGEATDERVANAGADELPRRRPPRRRR